MRRSNFVIFVLAAIFPASCAVNTAPIGFLQDGYNSQKTSFGGWIEIKYNNVSGAIDRMEGEFISFDHDSVFVLTETGKLEAIAPADIIRAKITTFDAKTRYLGLWAFAGFITTPAQGLLLVATAPGWLLFGAIPTAVHSHTAQMRYPAKSFEDFRKFARFPQGLPEGYESFYIPARPDMH